ncbi:septum formation family protein [Microbacterium sp.]|uniref:septum formation family protein n=1 Tax=Microbacterium sp. TaxID=51671 RepID=UPI002811784F|nr:septum formation family protein [Microbacterium sp.]
MPANRTRRTIAFTGTAVILAAMLSGCSIAGSVFGGGDAQRDEDGNVTQEKEIDIFSLKVGDCLTEAALSGGETTTAPVIPCDEAHPYEVYAEFELEDGEFPGTAAIETPADEFCLTEFEKFVGVAYDASALAYTWFEPTAESWSADDRLVQCVIGDPAGDVEGSLKGVKR